MRGEQVGLYSPTIPSWTCREALISGGLDNHIFWLVSYFCVCCCPCCGSRAGAILQALTHNIAVTLSQELDPGSLFEWKGWDIGGLELEEFEAKRKECARFDLSARN